MKDLVTFTEEILNGKVTCNILVGICDRLSEKPERQNIMVHAEIMQVPTKHEFSREKIVYVF